MRGDGGCKDGGDGECEDGGVFWFDFARKREMRKWRGVVSCFYSERGEREGLREGGGHVLRTRGLTVLFLIFSFFRFV